MKILKSTPLTVLYLLFLFCGQSEALLPKDAQAAIKKGINVDSMGNEKVKNGNTAGGLSDYKVAISYFQEARKLAPDAPEVYFDIGLEESKIPGRELRAMAWFGAFLSVNSKGENAKKAKEQIDRLEVKYKSNLTTLVQKLQDEAIKISDDHVLLHIAYYWAEMGDIPSAINVVDQVRDAIFKRWVWEFIIEKQCKNGKINDAKESYKLIQGEDGNALFNIAEAQAFAGDFDGMSACLNHTSIDTERSMSDIAFDLQGYDADKALKVYEMMKIRGYFVDPYLWSWGAFGEATETNKRIAALMGESSLKEDVMKYFFKKGRGENQVKDNSKPQNRWIQLLDGEKDWENLNREVFLDFNGYLNKPLKIENPKDYVDHLDSAVRSIVLGFQWVNNARKPQAKQKGELPIRTLPRAW